MDGEKERKMKVIKCVFVSEIRLRDHVDVGAILDKAKGKKERLSEPKRMREKRERGE